jgi:hypothetical protein
MRILLSLIVLCMLMLNLVEAQTAKNFNCKDCNGTDYDLFTELDAGKVVVLCWVMPCSSCILPATTAYNVVRSYASSHPGKVVMYVADDYANTSCNDINNWCYVYGLDSTVRFSNKAISMKDYGTDGMPKTVVLGGVWHKVYFNQNNGVNATNLQAAIDLALLETSVKELAPVNNISMDIVPNPVKESGQINISLSAPDQLHLTISSMEGRIILQSDFDLMASGDHSIPLPVNSMPSGLYFLHLKSSGGVISKKIVVI